MSKEYDGGNVITDSANRACENLMRRGRYARSKIKANKIP